MVVNVALTKFTLSDTLGKHFPSFKPTFLCNNKKAYARLYPLTFIFEMILFASAQVTTVESKCLNGFVVTVLKDADAAVSLQIN